MRLNLWLGILLIWSIILYFWYKETGFNYVFNLFCGFLVYSICVRYVEKKDIAFLLRAVLAVALFNIVLLCMQAVGFDPFNSLRNFPGQTDTMGLFALKACMGMYMAFAMCLLTVFSWWTPILFLVPIGLSVTTSAFLGSVIGYLFILWFRKRNAFWVLSVAILALSFVFVAKIDKPMGMMGTRLPMWKMVLKDSTKSPLAGYGLDSFRIGNLKYFKESDTNKTVYGIKQDDKIMLPEARHYDWWDNAHNEWLQLLFEFSFIGFGIVLFILYYICKQFLISYKTDTSLALMGFFIALLIMSIGQFPFHLARLAHLIPVCIALFVIETNDGGQIGK